MTTRANHLGVLALALAAAAMLAACMLALVGTVKPAGAAFPGQNAEIVFERADTDNFASDIFPIMPDGTGLSQLTETRQPDSHPSYSADGSQVVFDTDRDGNPEIYKMDADGSNQTRLTFDFGIFCNPDREPAFSPDGSEIVFWRPNQKGTLGSGTNCIGDLTSDIHIMSANGESEPPGPTRVVHIDGISGEPSFSPDGSKIVFDNPSHGAVYVVNRDGTDLRSLTAGRNPSWSPDGSLITFERNQQIFVMSADGSNQRQITPDNSLVDHLEPTFAPDCTRIAYVKNTFTLDPSGDDGTFTYGIYTSDLAGGDERQVIAGSERVFDPDWQPLSSTGAVDCMLPPPPPPTPQISIADTSVNEGDTGTSEATFNVTLSEASTNAVTVDYATADGTATQPEDYQQKEDTLTFGANQTTATVTVQVSGDTTDEPNESFSVNLSNPTNATISDAQGIGTITTDDQDTKVPQTDIALDPPTPNGENDWYTKTVNATISASDDSGSGVAETRCALDPSSPPDSFDDLSSSPSCAYLSSGASVSSDGQHTLYAASKDEAGNTETPRSTSFKIDKAAPTIDYKSASLTANADGWRNVDVTATFEATDSLSGMGATDDDKTATNTATTSGEGANITVGSPAFTDRAGNTALASVATSPGFKIDKTAPSAPAADTNPANPVAGSDGWFKDSVIVSYSGGSDPQLADGSPGSGIDASTYSASQTFDTSSDSHHYSGTVKDKAGNTSNPVSGTVKVDATDPSLDITGCPSALVPRDSIQKLTVTANDAHSGLATDLSGDLQLNTSTAGLHTETVTATDKVGHSTTKECTYTVNSAPSQPGTPTLSATSSTPNQGSYTLNWDVSSDTDNNLDHYVLQHKNSATDAQFSTVDDSVNGVSYSFGSGGNQPEDEGTWTYRIRAVDSLGEASEDSNESNAVKVDKSKPNAPLASAGPADYTDQNGDKWYKDSATAIFSANGDPPLADGSDGSGVKSVSDPVSLNTPGVLDYSGTATDNSGNESDATSGSVKVDAEAPTSSASAKDSANNDYNSSNWANKDVTVTLSASDDQGSGVKHIAYSVNGNADTAAGSSKQITVSAEGTTTITFHAVDNVGKEEAQEHTFTVKSDKSAPTISDLSATTSPNGAGWYNTDVTNRFKASDSGSGLSTACQTSFPLSAGENVQSKTTSGEGSALKVTSDSCTDVAGNTATGKDSATFKIDKSAPSVSGTILQANATNVSRTIQEITANFAQGGSGIDPNTLNSQSVQLFSGNSTKPVKATPSDKTPTSVTLTPSSKLDANKTYTAKIKGGATGVKDLADNPLASDFSWTFTTGAR